MEANDLVNCISKRDHNKTTYSVRSEIHDNYVNSLGGYFHLSWVRYNSRIGCVISISSVYAARQGDPQQIKFSAAA